MLSGRALEFARAAVAVGSGVSVASGIRWRIGEVFEKLPD